MGPHFGGRENERRGIIEREDPVEPNRGGGVSAEGRENQAPKKERENERDSDVIQLTFYPSRVNFEVQIII